MTVIGLTLNKEDVYKEVKKTTNYTGAKMNDAGAWSRISTTEADNEMLERFWQESKSIVCNKLKRVLSEENEISGEWKIELNLSKSYDDTLTESIEHSLFSFFVMNITAKWYTFSNKDESTGYATEAATYIEDIMRKAYFKKKPTRPTYD